MGKVESVLKHCGDCRWYIPTRNPDTNRILPTQAGQCGFPVELPKVWPQAYWSVSSWGRSDSKSPNITRNLMYDWEGTSCECFEPKPASTPKKKKSEPEKGETLYADHN